MHAVLRGIRRQGTESTGHTIFFSSLLLKNNVCFISFTKIFYNTVAI